MSVLLTYITSVPNTKTDSSPWIRAPGVEGLTQPCHKARGPNDKNWAKLKNSFVEHTEYTADNTDQDLAKEKEKHYHKSNKTWALIFVSPLIYKDT